MPTLLPELTDDGLILWRLHSTSEHELRCIVGDFAGELALHVYDPATRRTTFSEVHETTDSAIDRAGELRNQLMTAGWAAVEVDVDKPD